MGQEFLPQLDEGDALVQVLRVPGTSVEQSQAMQFQVERALSRLPEVKFVFSKTGTAELASDPMPPNISDTFVIMKDREAWPDRSEEHTSELQSLMRISYAVFCLKKKNTHNKTHHTLQHQTHTNHTTIR